MKLLSTAKYFYWNNTSVFRKVSRSTNFLNSIAPHLTGTQSIVHSDIEKYKSYPRHSFSSLTSKDEDSSSKVAVITGGGSGIGQSVARRLSLGGWTVVLAGRRIERLQETEAMLNGNPCLCVATDVTVEKDVETLFQTIEETYGKVDLLFNNAGINSPATSVEDVKYEDFEQVMKINVLGPFLCAKVAMKLMAKNGGGRIINNGSISSQVPRPHSVTYTTSKHAVNGLTKQLALDGRALNVACGQIDFGNVVSELSLKMHAEEGALQPNGTKMKEPVVSMENATEAVWTMANLPLDTNVLNMTVMATKMPFVGRG